MSSGAVRDGVLLSVGTLTALPVAPPSRVDGAVAGAAMLAAPLPGLMLGALAAGVVACGQWVGAPALASSAAAFGAVALGTRGLHLDGLADTADGLAASYERERALAVMRSGDVGPAGVVTLVLVLLLDAAALASLLTGHGRWHGPVCALVAVLAGRCVLPLVCAGPWPSARPGGLGAAVARSVPRAAAAAAGALTLLAVLGVGLLAGLAWWALPSAVLLGWSAAALLVAHVARRLGGTTGDVLGAAVETATATALVVLASVL